jgi:drug/metabolite transporter (DMT)-like permease
MNSMKKGIFYVVASAVIFGFTPILARITYDDGANGATITFLRGALAAPFLFVIMKNQKIPFASTRQEIRDLLWAGLGSGVTTILLYTSYTFVSVGTATTLHFIYPVMVSLGCVVFYKDKLNLSTVLALILCTGGVFLFFNKLDIQSVKGFLFAVASGITFAFSLIYVEKSSLKKVSALKISFVLSVVSALCPVIGAQLGVNGELVLSLPVRAWIYAGLVALLASVVGISLLQKGIKYIGATKASILSTVEPITSIFCGVVFLGETLSFVEVVACIGILTGVVLIIVAGPGLQRASYKGL